MKILLPSRTMRRAVRIALILLAPMVALAKPKAKPEPSTEKDLSRTFYQAGEHLFNNGQFIEAAKEFERAFEKAPTESTFLYNIALAYDKGGERKPALDWYQRYIATNPNVKEMASAKARVVVLQREIEELSKAAAPPAAVRKLPPPLPFVEQVTKATFQTWIDVDGKPYTLIGAGARKYFGFKVYGMGLYVEDEPARAAFPKLASAAGGADHDTLLHGDLVYEFIELGDFGKIAQLHFIRDVKAKDSRDSYRDALADTFSSSAPGPLRKDAEAFLAMIDDVKEGEDLFIRTTTEGQIMVRRGGGAWKMGPINPRLAHDVWFIWLGKRPISEDLKRSIVDRIDTMGR